MPSMHNMPSMHCIHSMHRGAAARAGPFIYRALPPDEVTFTPLKQTQPVRADHLMARYLEHDQDLRKFVPIIQGIKNVTVSKLF